MATENSHQVVVCKNGPYLVSGGAPLSLQKIKTDAAGDSLGWSPGRSFDSKARYALCRCGQSNTKPFCDGTHAKVGFDGTETASKAPYEELATEIVGSTLVLNDAESLCAFARFCDVAGSVWHLTENSDDPAARKLAIAQAQTCPSGRLVMRDEQEVYEPMLEASVALIEDTAKECSGPILLRGGIAVIAEDGEPYPVRNRQTLCRCGASQNKPFCDGTHAEVGFVDGL